MIKTGRHTQNFYKLKPKCSPGGPIIASDVCYMEFILIRRKHKR
jgi:hypothetical protein